MKLFTPEISWHNREPILSVDIKNIEPEDNGIFVDGETSYRMASAGYDKTVFVWRAIVTYKADKPEVNIDTLCDLPRHSNTVNVVRFSPTGNQLACGDDEGVVYVWKLEKDKSALEQSPPSTNGNNLDGSQTITRKESWNQLKLLRGHVNDVVDLAWSPDGTKLLSGSIDNEAILWDAVKLQKIQMISGHKNYVQGVAWDPLNQFMATLSADRNMRIFNVETKRTMNRVFKMKLKIGEQEKNTRLFYDDTLRTYCRRLCFSPHGEFVLAPAGIVELSDEENEDKKYLNCVHLFLRNQISKPAAYYSTGNTYNTVVRCSPILYELLPNVTNPYPFPYRIVFAIATKDGILIYDTQRNLPFTIISDIHYARLSDISWSNNGRILLVSSTDGFCTIITFTQDEIGDIYTGEPYVFQKPIVEAPVKVPKTPKLPKVKTPKVKTPKTPVEKIPKTPKTPTRKSPPKKKEVPASAKITNFFTKKLDQAGDYKMVQVQQKVNENGSVKRKEVIDLADDSGEEQAFKKMHIESNSKAEITYSAETPESSYSPIIPLQRLEEMDLVLPDKFHKAIPPVVELKLTNGVNCSKGNENCPNGDVSPPEKTVCQINNIPDVPEPPKAPRRVSFITITAPKKE